MVGSFLIIFKDRSYVAHMINTITGKIFVINHINMILYNYYHRRIIAIIKSIPGGARVADVDGICII